MKLSMMINYVGDFQGSAKQVVELEKVGLDMVWVAEVFWTRFIGSPVMRVSPHFQSAM